MKFTFGHSTRKYHFISHFPCCIFNFGENKNTAYCYNSNYAIREKNLNKHTLNLSDKIEGVMSLYLGASDRSLS